MLEAYQAYATYDDMAELTRSWCWRGATPCSVPLSSGTPTDEHDLGGEWRSVTLHDAVSEAVGQNGRPGHLGEELRKLAAATMSNCEDLRPARSCWSCSRSSSSTR